MIKKFLNENVTIFLKNGFRYSGVILAVDEKFVIINDRYNGEMLINLESIQNFNVIKNYFEGNRDRGIEK